MRLRHAIISGLLLASPIAGWTQEADDPVQALVEQERIRALVESAYTNLADARQFHSDDTAFVEAYTDIAYELGTADPAVVPLLANETLQATQSTFYLAAYALAFQATPEAIEALVTAIERADEEQTGWAEARKQHLIWALASAGDVRAIRLADQGRHKVGEKSVHTLTSVLEAATVMTAPASLEILHEELSKDDLAPPEENIRTMYSVRTLGRIGDPSSLPVLLALAKSDNVLTRIEAVRGLAHYPAKESIDTLFAALQDPAKTVSAYAAFSLLLLLPEGRFTQVAEQIDTVEDQVTRQALYKTLARLDAEAAVPFLESHTANPDPVERRAVYEAAALIRSPALVLDLLIHGMGDPNIGVGIEVVKALARMDEPRAQRVLVRTIDSPRWSVAQTAAKLAANARLPGAAETIRNRLLNIELPQLTLNSAEKPRAEWLLDRVIELEDVKALRGLEKSLEVQQDGLLIIKIETAVKQLRAARDAGEDLDKWEALAFDADAEIRETAYRHLGRAKQASAAAAILASALGRAEPTESPLIVRHLAGLDTKTTRDVVERILTTTEYQRPELYLLRNSAAWAARRLGGERMRTALERSIEMRHGRDIRPIIYYTLLSGERAIPLIEKWIVPRMRFSAISRGSEHRFLRELLTTLRLGHEFIGSDVPPAELRFM